MSIHDRTLLAISPPIKIDRRASAPARLRHDRTLRQTRNRFVDEAVIEVLADSEAELRERVASLEADVGTYREIANAALDALVHVTQQNQRLRNDYQEQGEAYRWLCQETLLRAGADDDETR